MDTWEWVVKFSLAKLIYEGRKQIGQFFWNIVYEEIDQHEDKGDAI